MQFSVVIPAFVAALTVVSGQEVPQQNIEASGKGVEASGFFGLPDLPSLPSAAENVAKMVLPAMQASLEQIRADIKKQDGKTAAEKASAYTQLVEQYEKLAEVAPASLIHQIETESLALLKQVQALMGQAKQSTSAKLPRGISEHDEPEPEHDEHEHEHDDHEHDDHEHDDHEHDDHEHDDHEHDDHEHDDHEHDDHEHDDREHDEHDHEEVFTTEIVTAYKTFCPTPTKFIGPANKTHTVT
jgi:hypothetical protein